MSGRVCSTHNEFCPEGTCRWCEPVAAASLRARLGHREWRTGVVPGALWASPQTALAVLAGEAEEKRLQAKADGRFASMLAARRTGERGMTAEMQREIDEDPRFVGAQVFIQERLLMNQDATQWIVAIRDNADSARAVAVPVVVSGLECLQNPHTLLDLLDTRLEVAFATCRNEWLKRYAAVGP